MLMNAITTGFLAIVGAVFCSYPRFIYIIGVYGLGGYIFWNELENSRPPEEGAEKDNLWFGVGLIV